MNEIITNARRLLKVRIDSLEKDVSFCILENTNNGSWPAPFPALLYCFSTIDLLGTLYWKCTLTDEQQQSSCTSKIDFGITNKSLNYMTDYMRYPELEAKLIQKVFRHKLVHMAQPLPKARYGKKNYSWQYFHNDRSNHLSIVNVENNTYRFSVSIWSFVEDIKDSVFGPRGYLDGLARDTPDGERLRDAFKKAYQEFE
ncbi:hypothetical protein [Candidatus Thiodiazotropha sp. CDECU1]|uniref:hypothetical protein n=1 Tax=Candidatus Thiodiazotropha sp. CDECU1 TaxID=3065865 RepID=UPI002931A0F8|nr:hypothetical protein [Candidatus Thiodiazotropha sp. CDECU1]